MIFMDTRWAGDHGIGKFSRILEQYLSLNKLKITGSPASALDPLRLYLAMALNTPKDACVFNPGYNAPLFLVRKYVFTIMDLNHIDRPENSSAAKRFYYKLIMRPAARRANGVLTISEFSRQRIINWASIDSSKVINVGCGVDSSFNPQKTIYNPGYQYILCVSNRKKHKNEGRVIHAFHKAAIENEIHLIFTGHKNEEIQRIIGSLNLEDRIVFVGNVPEKSLPSLYRGALGLVFPSLYEGFGLPPLEAMACGTPVITSNTTSLPEVVGDAAILVNPLKTDEITHAIQTIVKDNHLRQELREKGLQRAKLFSWEKTAELTWKVLQEVARQS